jgi:hypothetical protein
MLTSPAAASLWRCQSALCAKQQTWYSESGDHGRWTVRLFCLFGLHQRSPGLAHYDGDGYVSSCKYCGVAMKRLRSGKWIVAGPSAAH